jgi:ribosomal protein S12 methylthiotransferase accessory factor
LHRFDNGRVNLSTPIERGCNFFGAFFTKITPVKKTKEGKMIMEMKIGFPGGKRVYSDYKGFKIETDQSKEEGGENSAPTPSDLFFASIGTCVGIYALEFCELRNIDSKKLKLTLELQSNGKTHMVEKLIFKIDLPPEFPERYTSALIRSLNLCYVKKHLQQPPQFDFVTNTSG